MRLATARQCREIDDTTISAYGSSGEILMEAAGALAARELDQSFFPEISRGMTAVVCGPGNNGGDGLVLARHLHSAGHRDIIVFIIGEREKRSELFGLNFKRVEANGIRVVDIAETPEKLEQIRSAELVVDAVFGIGLSKTPEGEFLKSLELMNSLKVPVVSLDCPSGLDCDTGVAHGAVVKAAMTLSFGLAKPGFFVSDGPLHVGKLRVLPIGYSHECLRGVATTHFSFNEKLARRYLPNRKDKSNKSDYGRLLVLAGSSGMWGAGVLASTSAFRVGAGYVTWASHEEPVEGLKEIPEVLSASATDSALWEGNKFTAVAVGPGLGVNDETLALIKKLKLFDKLPVVLDADAITTCVEHNLFPLHEKWVLTPHSGELSRIIKKDVQTIEKDRYAAVLEAAEITGCHVLLKGYRSIIGYQNRCMVINAGNSALAKAGTGDVLTGMIGGLLAQGLDSLQGTATAAYIHGRMADEWVRIGHDKGSLSASDLKEHLPVLMGRISGGSLI